MTPYREAFKRSLLEGLILLEGVVTQPAGLTYDLRAARAAFMEADGLTAEGVEEAGSDDAAVGGRPARRARPTVTLDQALQNLNITRQTLTVLEELKAVDALWAERTRKVLARAEQRLGAQLRQRIAGQVCGLYVILDPQVAKGRDLLQLAETALKNGARVLQLRDKQTEKGLQLPLAKQLTALCDQHKALFFVNDHADLTGSSGAHGLHVGQKDLSIEDARKYLAPRQLIGRSNATLEEALASQQQGADYIAVGAMFPSTSKDNTRPAGVATLRRVREQSRTPLVAIGGITEANVDEVMAAGADSIAVISAVLSAPDPGQAAARLSERIERVLAARPAAARA
ncbi:MAG: thiamine phosphate synthase [Dehalococcoidia bacterium]|nr:thiamine phosphate synthase [Dehalococcoidia bacterium]